MRAGYGRGYYGSGQLTPKPPPRRRSWFTIVAVIGVGAAVAWFMWPRARQPDLGTGSGGREPEPPPAPVPTPSVPVVAIAPVAPVPAVPVIPVTAVATGAFLKQLEDDARSRGFLSVNDFEDSVVASAKQLQAAGAQVVLAPHLQHLASRLTPPVS